MSRMISIAAYESVTEDHQAAASLSSGEGLGHSRYPVDIDKDAVTSIEPYRERGRILQHYYVATLTSGNTFITGDEGRAPILGLPYRPPA